MDTLHRPTMGRRKGTALTRQDVLRAALDVVHTHGPHALGTAAVADALGIRPPSIYHHFAGNDALHHAVAVSGWQQLLATLPADLTLRTYAHAYRSFAMANPSLYRVMTETPFDPTDPELLGVAAQGLRSLSELGLREGDVIHALRGLRAMLHGFVDMEIRGQVRLDVPSADESFAWLIEVVLHGLANRRGVRDESKETTP